MEPNEIRLLDFIETPIFVLEPDEFNEPVYVAFNAIARKIASVSLDDVLGKKAWQVYPGGFGHVAFGHHCEVLRSGQSRTYELTLPLAGRNRHIKTHLTPVLNERGRVARMIGASEDITAENHIRTANADSAILRDEFEVLTDLTTEDLQSSLEEIQILSAHLSDGSAGMSRDQLLTINKLDAAAERTKILVSDMLARQSMSKPAPVMEEFDLEILCEEVFSTLGTDNIHSVMSGRCWLLAERSIIKVVLRSLFDNAFRYSREAFVQLRITAKTFGDQYVLFTVSDSGTGFPTSTIDFLQGGLFDESTGYGLLGTRQLIHARNGNISAEHNEYGSGAAINVLLPGKLLSY